jgi:tetratricopeptide (TPR) repeat protein
MPIVTFGLLFFYVTHSVESGVIPISDLAFEHRNYLPLFGIFLAIGATFAAVIKKYPSKARSICWILIAGFVFLAQATWFRNQMWVEQETLLKQDVIHNPENVRALHNLALWYQRNERYDDSMNTMKTLLNINNGQLSLLHATSYVAILIDLRLHRQALILLDKLLEFDVGPQIRASLLRQYGTVHTARADDEAAVTAFEASIRLAPLDYNSGLAYGYSLIQLGRLEEAETLTRQLNSRFGDRTKLKMLEEVLQARAFQTSESKPLINQEG